MLSFLEREVHTQSIVNRTIHTQDNSVTIIPDGWYDCDS